MALDVPSAAASSRYPSRTVQRRCDRSDSPAETAGPNLLPCTVWACHSSLAGRVARRRCACSIDQHGRQPMRQLLMCSAAIAALVWAAGAARADDNTSRSFESMQATGTAMAAFEPVPADRRQCRSAAQEPGADQAAARGFKINLYAIVPDARHMAVGPQGVVDLRRHAQGCRLGGDRPQQGRHCRRGEAVRSVARPSLIPERRLLLEGRVPLRRRAQPRLACSQRRSSSTRARTSRSVT